MNVREFNSIGHFIEFAIGTNGLATLAQGAFTVLAVAKLLNVANDAPVLDLSSRGIFGHNTTNMRYLRGGFQDATGPAWTTANSWCYLSWRKASGTTTVDFSKCVMSTDTYTHATSSESVENDDQSATKASTRTFDDNDFVLRARVAAIAAFGAKWTQQQYIDRRASFADWLTGPSPIAAWKFDQASTSTAVTDEVGDADQSNLVGSSVITTDDPPNWSYGGGVQNLNVGFHTQINQLFAPTVANQSALSLSIGHLASGLQIFAPTLQNQNALNLNIPFKASSHTIYQPTINNEGEDLFEPILLGNGSLADRIMAGLIDQGFLFGSLADREYLRLLNKLGLAYTGAQTLAGLYELASEDNRLAGLELFGAALP